MRPALPVCFAFAALAARSAHAVPGPDTTVVLENSRSADSTVVADAYVLARDVPPAQRCVVDVDPALIEIPVADYRALILEPLRACAEAGGFLDRLEAVVVTRGLPLNVLAAGDERLSITAALGLWDSTDVDGALLVEGAPGIDADCGVPCRAFRLANPFRDGVFGPGFAQEVGGVGSLRLLLSTRLDGRTLDDALSLIDSAVAGEVAAAPGAFLLMRAPAGDPRGALDSEFDDVRSQLEQLGHVVLVQDFTTTPPPGSLLGFVVGTSVFPDFIEQASFAPGSIVDNLTSFGAVPENFRDPPVEVQVSVARFVARGVAGVHGTTDEPLSNSFPSRQLLVDYAKGFTLAESYGRNLPCIGWKNLVLGDPMAAPHAQRPAVEFGDVLRFTQRVRLPLAITAPGFQTRATLYADGVALIADDDGCVNLPLGDVQLLAVAQIKDDETPGSESQAKGWSALHVNVVEGDACAVFDPGPAPLTGPCCACSNSSAAVDVALLLLLLTLLSGRARGLLFARGSGLRSRG